MLATKFVLGNFLFNVASTHSHVNVGVESPSIGLDNRLQAVVAPHSHEDRAQPGRLPDRLPWSESFPALQCAISLKRQKEREREKW